MLAAFGVALFVLPVQTWWDQRDDLDERREELAVLIEVNARLEDEIARLNTDAGVIAAARDELGFVQVGERRLVLVDRDGEPANLPTRWPYSVVDAVLDAREAHAAAELAARLAVEVATEPDTDTNDIAPADPTTPMSTTPIPATPAPAPVEAPTDTTTTVAAPTVPALEEDPSSPMVSLSPPTTATADSP